MKHWHYIYEIVMTDTMREEDVPEGHAGDHGGLDEFQVEAIGHDHEIFSEHRTGSPTPTCRRSSSSGSFRRGRRANRRNRSRNGENRTREGRELLTITTTHQPATDLGYLLHKHPDRFQTFDLPFGQAHVFYPEAGPERCTAALMIEVDTVRLTRRGDQKVPQNSTLLKDYINDRAYAAGSQLSQALNHVYRTAMSGRCEERAELAQTPIPLEARVESVRALRGPKMITDLFEPLGYAVEVETPPMDGNFPGWGDGIHHNVVLRSDGVTLRDLLNHLYVLLPALDAEKHYFMAEDEVQKLLRHGEGWLAAHPLQPLIQRRYLGYRRTLIEMAETEAEARAAASLEAEAEGVEAPAEPGNESPETGEGERVKAEPPGEETLEERIKLGELRILAVLEEVRTSGASSVLDAGCGEGQLLHRLAGESQVRRLTGVEVRQHAIRRCLAKLSPEQKLKTTVLHGSLTYADPRLAGHDAAVLMEVVEHVDPERLEALGECVFAIAKPGTVIVTTPNREYNILFEGMEEGRLRHRDHRFEWTREEFREWAQPAAAKHGYAVRFEGIGEENPEHGHPTQMAVFTRRDGGQG